MLHGGFKPELAIYVRLELLEGLSILYGGGNKVAARGSLLSAQAKWQQLAVSDDALAQLLSMGFTASEVSGSLQVSYHQKATCHTAVLTTVCAWQPSPQASRHTDHLLWTCNAYNVQASRALRFCSGDVQGAAAFLLQQRQQAAERQQADRKRRAIRKGAPPQASKPSCITSCAVCHSMRNVMPIE